MGQLVKAEKIHSHLYQSVSHVQGICTSARPPTSNYNALAFENQSPFFNFYIDINIKKIFELNYDYYLYKNNIYKIFFLIFNYFIFNDNHNLITNQYKFNN